MAMASMKAFSLASAMPKTSYTVHLSPYARRVFDHGLGRSIWFSQGQCGAHLYHYRSFPENRRADLWSGIGLACTYAAGVVDRKEIEKLQILAGLTVLNGVGSAIARVFAYNRDMQHRIPS